MNDQQAQQSAESRELEYLLRTGKAFVYRGKIIELLDSGQFSTCGFVRKSRFDAETVIDKLCDDEAYDHDEADEPIASGEENDEHRLGKWDLV